jgi:uridine kinase
MIIYKLNKWSYFLYLGLFLKLSLAMFLASPVLNNLFVPFINYFVLNNFENPYEHFLGVGNIEHFPYPTLMLYILSFPKLILQWIYPNNDFFNLFLFRLPLIIADLSILFIMKSWLNEKHHNKLLWLYWFSPVLIYISYVHGQLDVIPISLLFGCLFFLFKEKYIFSAVLLGMALATKTNIALALPFYILYINSKGVNFFKIIVFVFISLTTFFIINLPYLWSISFLEMVFNNQEQTKFFKSYITLNELNFFLIPSTLLILFIRGSLIKIYNRDIFIMLLGFSFSIILLFITPQPGWYFWIVPFLSYFYIKEEGNSSILFFSLQLSYFLYFGVIKESDNLNISSFLIQNLNETLFLNDFLESPSIFLNQIVFLAFTLLQTTLLINSFWIYKKGLESYSQHKITASPFLVGIGGNSGTGKTTISEAISELFTNINSTIICGDDMHKWQRGHKNWEEFTHLDPKANNLHEEILILKKIKKGQIVSRRNYDHLTGTFTKKERLKTKNIIIFEGLHPFYLSSQRKLFDLKIFMNPSLELMYHWKILRDKELRGYSKTKVLEIIKNRKKDTRNFIETQLAQADVVINYLPIQKIKKIGDPKEKINLYYKLILSNEVHIEPLLEAFQKVKSLKINHQFTNNDYQEIILKGSVTSASLEGLANEFLYYLKNLGINSYVLPKGLFGIVIIILTYYMFEKSDYDRR